jgi:hypothetical protein
MLQVNTPNGVYSIRKRDAKTRQAEFLWEVLPQLHRLIYFEDHSCIEEVIACITGDGYDSLSINTALEEFPTFVILRTNFQELHRDSKQIALVCTDKTISYPEATLRRRFQLIDDYLNDNPIPDGEEASITLPFSSGEISKIIRPTDQKLLLSDYDTLCYLNPKSNLYFFYYNLTGINLDVLTKLSNNLTVEERANLVQYGTRRGWKVPSTEGIYILGLLDSVRNEREFMIEIYEKSYPSYLFCTLHQHINPDTCVDSAVVGGAVKMLLTYPFEIDLGYVYSQCEVLKCVKEIIVRALIVCNLSTSDCAILAEMAGITNVDIYLRPLPYDVPPYADPDEKTRIRDLIDLKYMKWL